MKQPSDAGSEVVRHPHASNFPAWQIYHGGLSTTVVIEVYRNQDSATIGHLQSLLESEGIETYLRNEYAASTTIAVPEVTPALCILDDADVERGVELIRAYIESSDAIANEEQTCPQCGDKSPRTFAVCWKCGAALDSRP